MRMVVVVIWARLAMSTLFNFLVGPEVGIASVQAQSVNAGERFLRSENFTAFITYKDGSVCNLVYTALGGGGCSERNHDRFRGWSDLPDEQLF